MNLNLWRKGKPYVGPVCWAHPDLCKDVTVAGYYPTKTMPPGVGDKVRKRRPVKPDGQGGWLYG